MSMVHIKRNIIAVIFCLLVFPCFGESDFSLRLAPSVKMPITLSQFNSGFGAGIYLDWAFWNFAKDFDLGVSAGSSFTSLPVQVGDPLTLIEGKAGPFIRWSPYDRWSFYAGVNAGAYQYSRGKDNDTKGLFGGSLAAQFHLLPYFSFYAEGGYTYRIFGSTEPLTTLEASVGIRLNLTEIMGNRTRVKVEKTGQYNVFPVSWAWYENNPVAMVRVTNEEPNAITDVELLFFMESYMSQPWRFAAFSRLEPGESAEAPVTALFNEAMLSLKENVNSNGILQIKYRSLGAKKETIAQVQMPIFRRNNLSWDDDRRAAAFSSPRDSSARLFARYVAGAVEAQAKQGSTRSVPANVRYAAALFEALRLYGISYIIDPSSAYTAMSDNATALDSLNYPYETLKYRGGDCDDLSILFCALLEALDIESAFITIPGHIYIAFELGDANWHAKSEDIIEAGGKRWLPVEITIPNEGFNRAWRIGANQWKRNGKEAELFPIREAWELYPPVTVPASGYNLTEMPELNEIVKAMEKEIK